MALPHVILFGHMKLLWQLTHVSEGLTCIGDFQRRNIVSHVKGGKQ
jgi:hypothetical protein